jgi:hypothetical protein
MEIESMGQRKMFHRHSSRHARMTGQGVIVPARSCVLAQATECYAAQSRARFQKTATTFTKLRISGGGVAGRRGSRACLRRRSNV